MFLYSHKKFCVSSLSHETFCSSNGFTNRMLTTDTATRIVHVANNSAASTDAANTATKSKDTDLLICILIKLCNHFWLYQFLKVVDLLLNFRACLPTPRLGNVPRLVHHSDMPYATLTTFIFIFWCHDHHVRDSTHIRHNHRRTASGWTIFTD